MSGHGHRAGVHRVRARPHAVLHAVCPTCGMLATAPDQSPESRTAMREAADAHRAEQEARP